MLKSFVFSLSMLFFSPHFVHAQDLGGLLGGLMGGGGSNQAAADDTYDDEPAGPSAGQQILGGLLGAAAPLLNNAISSQGRKKLSPERLAKYQEEYDKLVETNEDYRLDCTDKQLAKFPLIEGGGSGDPLMGAIQGLISQEMNVEKDYPALIKKYKRQNAQIKRICKVKSTFSSSSTKSKFSFGSSTKKTTTKKSTTTKPKFSFGSSSKSKTTTTNKTTTKKSPFTFGGSTTSSKVSTKPKGASKSSTTKPKFTFSLPKVDTSKGDLRNPENMKEN